LASPITFIAPRSWWRMLGVGPAAKRTLGDGGNSLAVVLPVAGH